jgi:hypothetical protein
VSTPNRTLKQRAYQEMKEYLVISGYLFVVLGSFASYKAVILAENYNSLAPLGLALLNAFALGKVMLVAQHVHFVDRFKEEPLIYPTIFKSAVFAIVLACFRILEEAAIGLYHGESFGKSIATIGGGTLKGILIVTAISAVVLIPFFGFTELRRVFDEGKLEQLFFTSRHRAGTSA